MRSLWQWMPGGALNSQTLRGLRGSVTSWTVKPSGAKPLEAPTDPT